MKRGQSWFEKIIYGLIMITGFYIIYRGSGILAETGIAKRIFTSRKTTEVMREAAAELYLPGYRAALEQGTGGTLTDRWLRGFLPILHSWYEQTEERSERQREGEPAEEEEPEERQETAERESGNRQATEEESSADMAKESETEEAELAAAAGIAAAVPETLQDFDYLLNHYFVVDADTMIDDTFLNAKALLEEDLSMEKKAEPQILIYHTHSQEAFLDSVAGDLETGIVGTGSYLAKLLEEKYGYQVIHDKGVYDLVDGVLDRNAAYDYARVSVEQILKENPSIEVVIDLHRDGVEEHHFVTEENEKPTAQIMFFNGLSRNNEGRAIESLYNPYIKENLAFSFQLQLAAEKDYPGYTRNIYLKGQRFNLHLRPRSLLVEAGSQLNTMEEEKNAMEPLADILNQVLSGEKLTGGSD